MKIALIGDVHANLPALQAVLNHISDQNVASIWNVGDFVGYGPFPNEVIETIRSLCILSIIGNYDCKVLKFKKFKKEWKKTKAPQKYYAFKWAYKTLSNLNKKYLKSLPKEIRLSLYSKRILLTHGSPASDEEYISSDTSKSRLEEISKNADFELIICGHSHKVFFEKINNTIFINPGSVGRPDDGDPRACYSILEISKNNISVKNFRVKYDIKAYVRMIKRENLPNEFSLMICEGRSLEWVLGKSKTY